MFASLDSAAMIRLALAALILFLSPSIAAAQPRDASATCDCARELEWASAQLARNYAGFSDKVTSATRPAYDSLLAALRIDARGATTTAQCNGVLARWVAWFRDNHVSLSRPTAAPTAPSGAAAVDTAAIRARFATWERIDVGDEAAVRARLDSLGDARDPIEGIWVSADGRYRAAIVRAPAPSTTTLATPSREFAMVILRADSVWWLPGQVKASIARRVDGAYATHFYMLDHSERQWEARPTGPALAFSGGAPWLRRWPVGGESGDTVDLARFRASLNARFGAREIAPGTVLVSVPTFNDPAGMDSLWARHGALIRGAERLVIDVRGNGGGSDYNFREFMPLLYTDPVRLPANYVLSTDENLAAELALAADTAIPKGQREQIANGARAARRRRGADGWWQGTSDAYRAKRLARPREVAIIQDGGCASSCEGFLLRARQSRKVTTYGANSGGVFDYGNVRAFSAPCGTLVLRHPTTKSGYLPQMAIDNVGIPPQVRIPPGEVFPIDWVLRRLASPSAVR